MPIIRRKLSPDTVYPEDIRYDPDTDQVQRKIGGEWVDAPESDPRTQTTFPPRSTSDPKCDGAQSVADSIKDQIDGITEAIDNAATVFTVAGLVLGLFTFGVFEIFIAIALGIANAMIDAGSTALEAALTTTAYDTLVCILYCHMTAAGRVNPGELSTIQSEVSGQIGGLGAIVLNSFLQLAGEGGINNLASIGTSTGDCADCDCGSNCGDMYDVRAPYTSPSHGTVIARTDHSVDLEIGTTGFAAIGSEDYSICCRVIAIEQIIGTPTAGAYIPCGLPYSEGNYIFSSGLTACPSWLLASGTPGDVIRYSFEPC